MTAPDDPEEIARRVRSRSKGEIIDYILRCRDILDKCTSIVSSPLSEEWRQRYYAKKYRKYYNRCRIAGNVLIEKFGKEPSAKTIRYVFTRHPDVFSGFVKEKYFYPAWEPVIRSMMEKDYLSKEDLYIMNVLDMPKRFILYLSLGE